MNSVLTSALHWLQFSDSALPIGAFSFSNGVETAAHTGRIRNAEELEALIRTVIHTTATVDGVIAIACFRAVNETSALHPGKDFKETRACYRALNRVSSLYPGEDALSLHSVNGVSSLPEQLFSLDERLLAFKLNEEIRAMSLRMGKKLSELAMHLLEHPWLREWHNALLTHRTPGNLSATQGLLFALAGNREEELFASLCYGVMNQMTGAALRCMKVTHFETQRLLFRLSEEIAPLYEEVRTLSVEEMHSFAPEVDLLASLHAKGAERMFMN